MEKENIRNILKDVEKISKDIDTIRMLEPYHINIIDEVHANENAHSRVFAKILQYKENNKFPFLLSFLNSINFDLTPVNPCITVEKDRIDVLIRDKNYAVIIENKIHGAADRDKQIERYIDKVKNMRYPANQIYVLYLSRWGGEKPGLNSLSDIKRRNLGANYNEISFQQNILPWLENILPECKVKDTVLISAINQYIDHLQGIFSLRKIFNERDSKMREVVEEVLGLNNETIIKKGEIINKKLEELNLCTNTLYSIRKEFRNKSRKKFLTDLFNKLNEDKNEWICVNGVFDPAKITNANDKNFGFKFNNKNAMINDKDTGIQLFLSIEIQDWNNFLCGICISGIENLKDLVVKKFTEKKVNICPLYWWVYLNLQEYDFDENKIAWNVYDDKWNDLYANNSAEIVEMYYRHIIKMKNVWLEICEEI